MMYVALAEAFVILALLSVGGSLLRTITRQHHRERSLLVNQLLHLAGKPWQEAPAEAAGEPVEERRRETIALPEQMP